MIRILCLVYAGRLLGLYMILPVLSPYASRLAGATSLLTGLALGAYGATQAAFQVPLGYLSDRFGRKRVIYMGLLLFAAGSVLGALARDAWTLVIARALQGSGAISSVVVALIADLTRDGVRSQAMARIGIWIGATFAISIAVGPFVAGLVGVAPLFLLTAAGAMASIAVIAVAVPEPAVHRHGDAFDAAGLMRVLRSPALVVIDAGIFLLHLVVTVLFVVLPFHLERLTGSGRTWIILAPAIAVGLLLMHWIGIWSDRRNGALPLFLSGAASLSASTFALSLAGRSSVALIGGLFLGVAAIAILEPLLAAVLSRVAQAQHRGTATGVYSMAQFSGAFAGGLVGGACLHRGQGAMFIALGLLGVIWGVGLSRVGELRSLGRAPVPPLGCVGPPSEHPE